MNIEHDLRFSKIVAEQFDDYLDAEALFYPVGSVLGKELPALCVGNWLEVNWRLTAIKSNDTRLSEAREAVRRVRALRPDLYQTKARREFRSRLDSWTQYLDERLKKIGSNYPAQVRHRFKMELLNDDVAQPNEQLERMQASDAWLRKDLTAGGFVWEAELAHATDKVKFWFLYGR